MRTFLCTCCLVFCVPQAWGQTSPAQRCSLSWLYDDRYAEANIKNSLRGFELGAYNSASDLAPENNGDGASVAVLKLVPHEELTTPKFVQAYLHMARVAFSRPDMIVCPEDRRPDVTLFLLGYLHDKVTDPDLRTQIESTEQYLRDETKANSDSGAPPPASTLAQPPPDQKRPPK
jgi:hypothetical protein